MKYLPLISLIIVQAVAMNLFVGVFHLDVFLSAGLSALIGASAALIIYFILRKTGPRKNGL